MKAARLLIIVVLFGMVAGTAVAGPPEYMKIDPRPGITIEAKGYVNDDGHFVATDIELLDGQRRPKIRGPIDRVDAASGLVVVLGHEIRFGVSTKFYTLKRPTLKAGQHIEVKSDPEPDGSWLAVSIETLNVKPSSKLKMTVTDAMVDGESPDTLDCSGFRILLVDETDIIASASMPSWRDYLVFREIAYTDPIYVGRGVPLANNKILFTAEYRHNLQSARQYDLSDQFASDLEDTQPEIRMGFAGYWTSKIRTLAQFRVRQKYIVSSESIIPPTELEAHFYQLNIMIQDIERTGLTFMLGRQRFKEPREWFFDEYLDAARLFYRYRRFGLEVAYIDAVNPFKTKFETWQDVYAAASLFAFGGKTTVYTLIRKDSDELRKREPEYYGVRYLGDPVRGLRLWGDVSILRGRDKQRDLDAWAVDAGATLRLRKVRFQPSATVAYAVGSGRPPGDTGTDGRYRQTGYQDNNARFGGVNSVQYYGALLDPELSNLEIATAAAGLRPHRNVSVELVYHRYFQQYASDALRGNLIDPPARPNGVDPDIGWEVDGVLGIRSLWQRIRLSWTIGVFQPGEAYGPRQKRAVYNRIDFRIQL